MGSCKGGEVFRECGCHVAKLLLAFNRQLLGGEKVTVFKGRMFGNGEAEKGQQRTREKC